MTRLEGILLAVAGITLAVVLGLLAEVGEDRIRSWWRARQIEKWEKKD